MELPLGKSGFDDSQWDYLVAVTEKPNPNWLNQKGNLLTQKLEREWLASDTALFRAQAYQ